MPSYTHFNASERDQLASLRARGLGVRASAREKRSSLGSMNPPAHQEAAQPALVSQPSSRHLRISHDRYLHRMAYSLGYPSFGRDGKP